MLQNAFRGQRQSKNDFIFYLDFRNTLKSFSFISLRQIHHEVEPRIEQENLQ